MGNLIITIIEKFKIHLLKIVKFVEFFYKEHTLLRRKLGLVPSFFCSYIDVYSNVFGLLSNRQEIFTAKSNFLCTTESKRIPFTGLTTCYRVKLLPDCDIGGQNL